MSSVGGTPISLFVAGLRNARAMEQDDIGKMERQLGSYELYPEIASRLQEHLAQTRDQASRLDHLLDSLGEELSIADDVASREINSAAATADRLPQDAILKSTFDHIAFENFESAAYRSLIKLAGLSGHTRGIGLLEQSLREELRMSRWLEDNIENITAKFVKLSTTDA